MTEKDRKSVIWTGSGYEMATFVMAAVMSPVGSVFGFTQLTLLGWVATITFSPSEFL